MSEWLLIISPHGNFATVTLPQKLRHMVTLPHLEKVREMWDRCRKVCWSVGEGRGDMGRSMRGVGKCVGVSSRISCQSEQLLYYTLALLAR